MLRMVWLWEVHAYLGSSNTGTEEHAALLEAAMVTSKSGQAGGGGIINPNWWTSTFFSTGISLQHMRMPWHTVFLGTAMRLKCEAITLNGLQLISP